MGIKSNIEKKLFLCHYVNVLACAHTNGTVSSNKPMKRDVYKVSRFGCNCHCRSLAKLGEGEGKMLQPEICPLDVVVSCSKSLYMHTVNVRPLSLCRRQRPSREGTRRGGGQPGGEAGGVRQRGRRQKDGHGHPPGGGQALRLLHQVRRRLPHLRLRPGEDFVRRPWRLDEGKKKSKKKKNAAHVETLKSLVEDPDL